ncbi:hypothetical protein [Archangium sp.]|uniref:hypothetical protein n=1 Tax=Archangium sp. TaxID=1872627 RepID=UPI00286CEF7B|nr:hypothetical protein [Archangium sp.]
MASPGGELPGVRMIGFHGEVEAAHTPARRAPILADEENWLVRPTTNAEGTHTTHQEPPFSVHLERGSLRVPETGSLPGVGTRLGPWPARYGYTVVLVGLLEQRAASRLVSHTLTNEPAVTAFIDGLARGCPHPAPERVAQVDGLVAWYCSETEAHTLWLAILREARLTLLQSFGHQPPSMLEESAWWLSRAALSDEDLYLAAACLKHAGSPHAESMLQAMLSEPPSPAEIQERMAEQLLFLNAEARLSTTGEASGRTGVSAPKPDAVLTSARDRVRQSGKLRQA